ncbi:MAG: hydantoinase B/oxoprolinase family protein [Pirellulales bacterium]
MGDERWQFWIDVGGTFTDCLARRPGGGIVRKKVLSSGVTKGVAAEGSTSGALVDPARREDPPGFWSGAALRLLDAHGNSVAERQVAAFDASSGRLTLDRPLDGASAPGSAYELRTSDEAPLLAVRLILGIPPGQPLPPVAVRLGTTRGTNALLTRRGASTAFVTTRGFADVLRIGYQNRPKLFELTICKPPPLFEHVAEIDERISAQGDVLTPLDESPARSALTTLREQGATSLAVCLLNAYANPAHERRLAALAAELGFADVSVSHEVSPLVKIVPRGDTTVVDAYLTPVLRDYLLGLAKGLGPQAELRLLTSAGGLVSPAHFTGKDSILSGPAGGVVGYSRVAQAAGFPRAIGFDMGGTSTDVARFDGRYELEFETQKAGVRVVAPTLAIETVAAGGGSLCRFDGVKLAVGPASAGADPGPACYGRGGPLAVTDLNVILERVPADRFPFPLDRQAIERRLQETAQQIAAATGKQYAPRELAASFLQVANANMASAIRSISVAKGYDPAEYVLVAFGGAAGQHACAVAEELGMQKILLHPDAGLLSAYGMGLADVVRFRAEGVYATYSPELLAKLQGVFAELGKTVRDEVLAEGVAAERIELRPSLDLRYTGHDAALNIAAPADGDYATAFAAEHRRLYGYVHKKPLEVVAARVEAVGRSVQTAPRSGPAAPQQPARPSGQTQACIAGELQSLPVYLREDLRPGDTISGPAIVCEPTSTTVLDPGWQAQVYLEGELVAEHLAEPRSLARSETNDAATACDPVLLEIFNNHFAAIAEQMGSTLRNTASSVNVKERLDFSCALFTAAGDLVVNAPHIPVHLGAMGETVRSILADNPQMSPGDVFVTNDPYRGGSHLPDVTVVTPLHDPSSGRLLFFTASRAHHAEIGGKTPGSMPPFSRNLAEEGVLIRNFKLVAAGQPRFEELGELLRSGPYPSRAVADNLADLAAQVAANHQGARDLAALVERYSLPTVLAYMGHIQAAAEAKLRAALKRLAPGLRRFTDHLDDGTPIRVSIDVQGDAATIDFTGTGPVLAGNLNANRAIVTAAVLYVLRCLIDEDIPLNQGVLAPVKLVLPECLLSPTPGASAAESPAIVGGNVETSQRVVDVLLGALGLAAASQGTMNNLLFGDTTFGYYETICGGSGATAAGPGADAVHTHMTNTRLTDPEVLERRYPIRLRRFEIRRGSGGAGAHRGGDGIVRELEFLRPLTVSILSQRRGPYAPYGLKGGSDGSLGRNTLVKADGSREVLPALAQLQVEPGDVLILETPGGGGWG